jgi:hypothetical protein
MIALGLSIDDVTPADETADEDMPALEEGNTASAMEEVD